MALTSINKNAVKTYNVNCKGEVRELLEAMIDEASEFDGVTKSNANRLLQALILEASTSKQFKARVYKRMRGQY